MTFDQARQFAMPFGKHKGLSLDNIATSDEGLRYLDYMLGVSPQGTVGQALKAYLKDPTIARELDSILRD